jgi:hypothetical protein
MSIYSIYIVMHVSINMLLSSNFDAAEKNEKKMILRKLFSDIMFSLKVQYT